MLDDLKGDGHMEKWEDKLWRRGAIKPAKQQHILNLKIMYTQPTKPYSGAPHWIADVIMHQRLAH